MSKAMVIELNKKETENVKDKSFYASIWKEINAIKQGKYRFPEIYEESISNNNMYLNNYEIEIIRLFRRLSKQNQWKIEGMIEGKLLDQLEEDIEHNNKGNIITLDFTNKTPKRNGVTV